MVELGDRVKCKVSGFSGIVCALAHHLTGCDRADVRPTDLDKDGKLRDSYWFDIHVLEILEKQAVKPADVQAPMVENRKVGGPPTKSNNY